MRLDSGRYLAAQHSVLGADDTVGVFLMLEMARRRVPGVYLWHAGEERGCVGSSALAASCPDWLSHVRMMIALDRHGTGDVITHQIGRETCSPAFARMLADMLNTAPSLAYAPCPQGAYTDSEQYAHLIPECTNLSVGYSREHSQAESVDLFHTFRLLDALCDLDVSTLPIAREPVEDSWGSWGLWQGGWRDDMIFGHRLQDLARDYPIGVDLAPDVSSVCGYVLEDNVLCPDCHTILALPSEHEDWLPVFAPAAFTDHYPWLDLDCDLCDQPLFEQDF